MIAITVLTSLWLGDPEGYTLSTWKAEAENAILLNSTLEERLAAILKVLERGQEFSKDTLAEAPCDMRKIHNQLRLAAANEYLKLDGAFCTCSDGDSTPCMAESAAWEPEFRPTGLDCDTYLACAKGLVAKVLNDQKSGPSAECGYTIEVGHFSSCLERLYDHTPIGEVHLTTVDLELKPLLPVPARWSMLSVGFGGVLVGALLIGIDGRCPNLGNPMTNDPACMNVLGTQPAGIAVLGSSAAIVVSAIVLWAVDRRKSGRARK